MGSGRDGSGRGPAGERGMRRLARFPTLGVQQKVLSSNLEELAIISHLKHDFEDSRSRKPDQSFVSAG